MTPPPRPWPDALDIASMTYLAVVLVGVPLLGYVFLALDVRAYLRSLRRALVVVVGRRSVEVPPWLMRWDTPACLRSLGLEAEGLTRERVLSAYRERVKSVHPDVGGDRRRFAALQRDFEQAIALLEEVR